MGVRLGEETLEIDQRIKEVVVITNYYVTKKTDIE